MSNFTLKCVALTCMTLDHVGAVLLSGNLSIIFRGIGRIAFPLYCFLLVEGFKHTKSKKLYLLRMSIMAVVSEPIYDWTFYRQIPYWGNQNIFFTLCCGLSFLIIADITSQLKKYFRFPCLYCIFLFLEATFIAGISYFIQADYHIFGIAIISSFYLFREKPKLKSLTFLICILGLTIANTRIIQLCSILALVPIYLYNGKRGVHLKYFFYVYYPLHLLTLSLLIVTPLVGIGVLTTENYRAATKPEAGLSGNYVEISNGTPELVNQIIRDGGLFEDTDWSSDTTSMLLVATDQKSCNFIYPDIFLSNGCFALLSTLSGNGWELRQGDEIICTFSVDMGNLSDFYQKNGGVKVRFYPIRNGYCDAYHSISYKGSNFNFSYTAPDDGIYYFGLCNFSSEKVIINQLNVQTNTP